MNNSEIIILKESLSNFLKIIKSLKNFDEDYTQEVKHKLFALYKELYQNYESTNADIINSNFSSEEIKAIHFLGMGKDQEDKFKDLLNLITDNSQGTIQSVTEFIKSRKGFELINNNETFEGFSDNELIDIFGSLFGVKIAKDCVNSLRAEKVGSVIGYALSGLCEEHLKEFKKNPNQDFTIFIKNKIQESDVTVSFTYNVNSENKNITCNINENLGSNSGIRPKNRFDHCFVNHKNKKIVFGLSSSSKTMDSQKFSYYQMYQIMNELVQNKLHNGTINKYYGYSIEPFYFLAGRFVADNEHKTQEVGLSFLKMFPNITKNEKKELAQLIFFSLYGNSPNEEATKQLALFNPFISGCDTLDIYLWQEKFKSNQTPIEHLKYLSYKLTKISKILNNSNFSLDDTGKTFSLTYLNDIQNIILSFGRGFQQQLNNQQYNEIILPLYQELKLLRDKMDGNEYGSSAIDALGRVLDYLDSPESFNKFVEKSHKPKNLPTILQNSTKEIFELNKNNLEIVATIAEQLAQLTSNAKKYLNNYAGILRSVIDGVSAKEAKGKYYSSNSSYNVSKNSAYYHATNSTIREFIDKTSFLIKKDLNSYYIDGWRFQTQLDELNDFINNKLIETHPNVLENTIHKIARKSLKMQ